MKDERLQLMVYGPGVAAAAPRLAQGGAKIERVTRTDSANHLFIQLRLPADLAPGPLELVLQRGDQRLVQRYELRARARGSAQRAGFSSADVVLNLMPDRFANGNPDNDNQPGMLERVDRRQPGGRHGGDIQGLIDHLDHIAGMGYTVVWPTPLTESNQPGFSYHGYAATDSYRIDPRYGTHDDYMRLSRLARAKGLCLIQDIVPNHIGSGHAWMKDLPAPDWFGFRGRPVLTNHARTTPSDPYAAQVDRDRYAAGWFDDSMPDMNQRQPLLATYQIQNAIWWIEEADLCGLRVDTYGYSDKAFIADWTRHILTEYPRLNIVVEEWSENPVVQAYWLGARKGAQRGGHTHPDGYTAYAPGVMDFVLQGALRKALVEPESISTGLRRLYDTLVNDRIYPEPGNLMLFDGNHDTPRLYSALDEDPALVRMALAYVLTARRVPQIYYGTEVLMTSPKRHDAFDAFRDDFPGGWSGDRVNAFTGQGLSAEQAGMQAWLRRLMNWRKAQPVIHHGALTHFAPEDGVYIWFRHDGRDQVMVAINKSTVDRPVDGERVRERLGPQASGTEVISGRRLTLGQGFVVPPRGVLIVQMDRP